jgi:hypothetical protein
VLDAPDCAIEAVFGVTLDGREHVRETSEDVYVPEPHDDVAAAFDHPIAWVIRFRRVLAAIAFDGYTVVDAGEVNDVLGDAVLTAISASQLPPP